MIPAACSPQVRKPNLGGAFCEQAKPCTEAMSVDLQVIGNEYPVTSPTFGPSGDLFAVSTSGDIFRYSTPEGYDGEFQMEAWGNSSGQPMGIDFDSQGVAFVCDAAHQAIFRILRVEREGGTFAHQIDPYVKEYEQSQFLGPNSLCLSRQTGMLYFTDSGPFGETSLQNPRGSVFAISPSTQLLIPLCLNTLAHPCGVALSPDEKNIYVAEMAMNRILRFTQHPPQVFHCSVFAQLSGRFGPTALAVSAAGDVYVAHFDFADNAETGRVVVLNPEGEVTAAISVPGPEITGLCISPDQRHLVVTERSTTSLYRTGTHAENMWTKKQYINTASDNVQRAHGKFGSAAGKMPSLETDWLAAEFGPSSNGETTYGNDMGREGFIASLDGCAVLAFEMGTSNEEVRKAQSALRQILMAIHVTDVLPERVRMLAVDVKLPLQSVLAAVLSEQHPAPSLRPKRSRGGALPEGGGPGDMLRREGRESLLEEVGLEEGAPLCTGVVSAAFPTDVLAEVCEIDASSGPEDASAPEEGEAEAAPAVRRWTSPDDGWGTHLIPSDLEKMPMGMPVTVGELADFLSLACSPKAQESEEEMLDWSLEQWRAYRLKLRMAEEAQAAQTQTEEKISSSRLDLVEGPIGPVLVHRVPCAPPRPILCADDADATLLKAVQLLLAYPQCDALPVVSPVRLTVMAHLTLSCCLAFLLGRLRGEELMPLACLKVGDGSGSAPPQRKFESSAYQPSAEPKAEDQAGNAPLPWVLSETQPLSELLCFFAKTHHSSVPIVEDEKGALVCNLSRRDLLSYLDLAMQSARQSNARDGAPDASEDLVEFNTAAPIEVLVKALRRYRVAQAQMQAPSAAPSTLQEQSLLDTLMAEAPQDPAKKGQAPPEATSRFSPGAHEHEFSVTSVLALSMGKLLRN
ncbi:drp35 [Symbiodinium sp. KB8]|nr:drp35 [Symbiodinium sp. KB8]